MGHSHQVGIGLSTVGVGVYLVLRVTFEVVVGLDVPVDLVVLLGFFDVLVGFGVLVGFAVLLFAP